MVSPAPETGNGCGTVMAYLLLVFCIVAAFAGLEQCTVQDDTSVTETDKSSQPFAQPEPKAATPTELASATREAESRHVRLRLPETAPKAPVLGFCTSTACAWSVVEFDRRDWPTAWSGDYQGQRNVAFCRQSGCDGAVQINVVEACAWRVIIVTANAMKADSGDTSNVAQSCNSLDESAKLLASNKASQMYQIIYGRNMP